MELSHQLHQLHYPRPFLIQQTHPALQRKKNVLLIGPTGCGKSLLAETLAHIVNKPFAKVAAVVGIVILFVGGRAVLLRS